MIEDIKDRKLSGCIVCKWRHSCKYYEARKTLLEFQREQMSNQRGFVIPTLGDMCRRYTLDALHRDWLNSLPGYSPASLFREE